VPPVEFSKKMWERICRLYELPEVTHAEPLNGDDNQVYKVSIPGSGDRVLRFSHPDSGTNQEIQSEFLVLEHLRQNSDLNVPSPIRDKHGRFFTTLCENDGSDPWQLSMFSYMEGEVLSKKQSTEDSMFLIGWTLGQLDIALEKADKTIKPPPSKIRIRRDGKSIIKWALAIFTRNSVKLDFLNGRNVDESIHPTVIEISNRLERGCKKMKRSLSHQLLHFDTHLDNLIFDGSKTGILDFENMAYGPRLYELAAPFHSIDELDVLKQTGKSPDGSPELISALFAGYENHIPMSQTEKIAFPLFRALRLFAELGWAVGRRNMPAWKEFSRLNVVATLEHIVSLLDKYESNAVDKKFFLSKWSRKTININRWFCK
jgi:Ser/Thr protein kinase RdoA (MazF antagonist)